MTKLKHLKARLDYILDKHEKNKKEGDEIPKKFWDARETFQLHLSELLKDRLELHSLTPMNLWLLLQWCSAYRPREPHAVLLIVGGLSNLDKDDIKLLKLERKFKLAAGTERIAIDHEKKLITVCSETKVLVFDAEGVVQADEARPSRTCN